MNRRSFVSLGLGILVAPQSKSTPVDMEQLGDILKAAPGPHGIRVDVDKDEITIVDAEGNTTKIPGSTIGTMAGWLDTDTMVSMEPRSTEAL